MYIYISYIIYTYILICIFLHRPLREFSILLRASQGQLGSSTPEHAYAYIYVYIWDLLLYLFIYLTVRVCVCVCVCVICVGVCVCVDVIASVPLSFQKQNTHRLRHCQATDLPLPSSLCVASLVALLILSQKMIQ